MGLPLFGITMKEFKLDPTVAAPYLKTQRYTQYRDRSQVQCEDEKRYAGA